MRNPKQEIEELQRTIQGLLLTEWDSIGVREYPEAIDEYDGYAPHICSLVWREAPVAEIFACLWEIETDRMGLPGNRERTAEFAGRLFELEQGAVGRP